MPTPTRRRWFQFGMWQVLEGMFWVAIAVSAIKASTAIRDRGDMGDAVAVFLLAGAPMGAAVGAMLCRTMLYRLLWIPLGVLIWMLAIIVVTGMLIAIKE